MNDNTIRQHVISLLSDFFSDDMSGIDNAILDDWSGVIEELRNQTVYGLPAKRIANLKLSNEAKLEYMMALGANIQNFHLVMSEQEKLLSLLESNGIKAVVLKGASAAMNYPCPEHRCMGDIDIIVEPHLFEKAFHIMKDNSYRPIDTLEEYRRHIGMFCESGVEIELHNYFSTSDNQEQNEILDNAIYKAIPNCVEQKLDEYKFNSLPVLENGIVLLVHINQHIGSGLGMRQIIDWMMYVEKNVDDEFWREKFAPFAESIGLKQMAMVVTYMCKKYLGLKREITWCDQVGKDDPSISDELIEYIFAHGNFSEKMSTDARAVVIIRMTKNPIQGLKTAQEYGKRNWKVLKKCPWLTPFAWLYQIIRWIVKGIRRGVTLKSFKNNLKQEDEETKFLERLGATRFNV